MAVLGVPHGSVGCITWQCWVYHMAVLGAPHGSNDSIGCTIHQGRRGRDGDSAGRVDAPAHRTLQVTP